MYDISSIRSRLIRLQSKDRTQSRHVCVCDFELIVLIIKLEEE